MRGDAAAARARAVEEVALALAIPHLLDRTVDTLSGGELQRVALAAALVTRPRLVLLDEPTSQLDPVAGDELIWLLRRLNEEWGVAVLLAEHRLERCLAAADRVIAMDVGRDRLRRRPARVPRLGPAADPALETPAARLFSLAGIEPLPVGVRDARGRSAWRGWSHPLAGLPAGGAAPEPAEGSRRSGAARSSRRSSLRRGTSGSSWTGEERPRRPAGASTSSVARGERVALMGRNGAGKSTLLRAAAGLIEPVARQDRGPGGIALLTQNPSDYLVRERVGDELPGAAGAGRAARRRARARGRGRPARPLRRRAPAPGPGDRPGGADGGRAAARAGRPRRADPRHGPRPQGRAGRA